MKLYKKSIAALLFLGLFSQGANGQVVLSSFEDGMTPGTKFVDTWEASPFNTGRCSNTPEVIDNPYPDDMNSSEKVLHYIRPYYSGDRNGVEIKLERSFNLSTTNQYIHAFIYKPFAGRILARGIDKNNNIFQFESLSSSESRANAWSDAVFVVKGNGYEIDRLVIYPDLETSVNRLTSDIDIYIDDIILSSSNVPRSVTDYCRVGGSVTSARYLSSIKTTGASLNLNATLTKPESVYRKYTEAAIVAEAGSPFTLQFTQKSTSEANETWIADVYADFNADKEFVSEGEYIGRITGVKTDDGIIFTTEVTVPVGTPVSSCALRIKLTDASDGSVSGTAHQSCSNVVDGMAINIPMEIAKYAERPIISISGVTEQGGWGSIRFQGIDGTEIKVANGTNVTVVATPNAGYTFKGWYNNETGGVVSESSTFSFPADYSIALIAKFSEIEFCEPAGTLPVKYWFGKAKIKPEGQSDLYYIGSASEEVNEISANFQRKSVMGGVNVKRLTTFTLTGIKASSSSSLSGVKAGAWADWNGDHVFSADEFIGAYNGLNDTQDLNITVPSDAITGSVYVRIMLSETGVTAEDACKAVGNGATYDLMITVAPNDSERFSLSATPNIKGAATFTLSPAPGEDGKYAAGTNVDITCVTATGYQFVQWMKDGIPYGATMTSNNPLPITALNQDLALTMKMEAKFPEYCAGTAPNNGDGDHYGITNGSVMINDVQAFTFTKGSTSITDLSSSCIAEVCPGDVIKIFVSGADPHSSWAQGIAYIDWNMDGVWNETTEAYELFNNPLTAVKNLEKDITVPDNVGTGCFGIRLCSGEAPAHNNLGGGPCKARKRGTLYTFRVNSSALPVSEPKLNITKGGGCLVTVTDSKGNEIANKESVEKDAIYTIKVVMQDEKYVFDNVTVNGEKIALSEEGNTYTGTFTADATGAKVIVNTNEKGYCESDKTMTRTDRKPAEGNDNRYLTKMSIAGGTYKGAVQSITVTDFSTDQHRVIYEDHTSQIMKCTTGDVLTPNITFNGNWMHKYVYVDWDRNYKFDVGSEGNWKELVSFNYVNGKNSAGATTGADGAGALGTFTVPSSASGLYRIRMKIDWDSTDPCGNFSEANSILNNGGGIADIMLNVDNPLLGIEENIADNANIFGGNEVIYISGIEKGSTEIYEPSSGKMIESLSVFGETKVNIHKGIYIVKLLTENGIKVAKVIVK